MKNGWDVTEVKSRVYKSLAAIAVTRSIANKPRLDIFPNRSSCINELIHPACKLLAWFEPQHRDRA